MRIYRRFTILAPTLCLILCLCFNLVVSTNSVRLAKDLSLSVPFGDPVAIRVDKTAHYSLVTEEGKAEFDALIPRGGHTVILLDPRSGKPVTYTVTLLHQLKCLGIIRENYNSGEPPSQLTNHCMNYLRQSTLCNINIGIEHSVKPKGNAVRGYDTVCRDWTKLYEEVERIQGAGFEAQR